MELGKWLELIQQGGAALAPILGVIWYLERKERIATQLAKDTLAERAVAALEKTANVMSAWREALRINGGP